PSVDLGVGGVEFQAESAANSTFAQGALSSGWITAQQYTFAGLADGTQYYFRVHARDAFGFVSNWSSLRNATPDDSDPTVVVDETPPLVAFQSPTNGSLITGLVGIYAVIEDQNLASFRLQQRIVGRTNFTDLVVNGSVARGDNFLALWDTRALSNGLYELR